MLNSCLGPTVAVPLKVRDKAWIDFTVEFPFQTTLPFQARFSGCTATL